MEYECETFFCESSGFEQVMDTRYSVRVPYDMCFIVYVLSLFSLLFCIVYVYYYSYTLRSHLSLKILLCNVLLLLSLFFFLIFYSDFIFCSVIRVIRTERLMSVRSISEAIPGLLAYSERHFSRVDR